MGVIVITGPIADGDVEALCALLRAVVATSDAAVIICDVAALPANARAIEALARLQLTARRLHRRIRLQRASPELRQLLQFAGLAGVVPAGAG
jgi:NADPH-dependent ferric siderophore reductase